MKKYLFMLMAACLTIFSVTSCEGLNDIIEGEGEETDFTLIKPEFKESGNTMSITYSVGSSIYSYVYGMEFTFSGDVCSKASVSFTCADAATATILYNALKAEEGGEKLSRDGKTIKGDVTEEYKGLKKDYLRSMCKALVDIYTAEFEGKETPAEKAYYKSEGNKLTLFYGSYGLSYSLTGKMTDEYTFETGEDWDGQEVEICTSATRVMEFATANIAEYIYRTDYLMEDSADGSEEEYQKEGKLDGTKIYENITEEYYGSTRSEIEATAEYIVKYFNSSLPE